MGAEKAGIQLDAEKETVRVRANTVDVKGERTSKPNCHKLK